MNDPSDLCDPPVALDGPEPRVQRAHNAFFAARLQGFDCYRVPLVL
jgi:hypothetical protein